MIKLKELGARHIVGLSALALTIAGLGFFAKRDFNPPAVAELPQLVSAPLPQLNANQSFEEKFLSGLRRLPANAFGSAEALKDKAGAGSEASADTAQVAPVSPASESKFWSEQEWRIAGKAVDDFRSSRKSQTETQSKKTGALSWRPPEEIANKIEKPATR